MKAETYGLSFVVTAGVLTLATAGFLPDAFGTAAAQAYPDAPAPAALRATISIQQQMQQAPPLAVDRDPFISEVGTGALPASPNGSETGAGAAAAPNPAGRGNPGSTPAGPEPAPDGLLGVIVGERALALISEGGVTRIVRAGASYQGHRITQVSDTGITLDDASHVRVALPGQ